MSIEELKARSRLTLHRKMSRSASFYQDSDALAPETIDVRIHYAGKRVGDLAGTNLSYAEHLEHPTELIFWNDDLATAGVTLDRGNFLIFGAEEGFYVDVAHPKDGHTQKVEVSPLPQDDLDGKTLPDGTVIGA